MTSEPTTPGPEATPTGQATALPLTGQRTGPDVPDENYWFQRHVVAYDHVASRVEGTVLDAGCGEGYGLRILRDAGARGVIGVDRDETAVAHARARYASDFIEVVGADLTDLPLVTDTMDAVVSLQVIEHLHAVDEYLAELVRITRPGHAVVIGTPNRLTFTPGSTTPTNPFHEREYTAAELSAVLEGAGIEVQDIEGVRHGPALDARLLAHVDGDMAVALADPDRWSRQLREVVHAITPADFVVSPGDLDTSLDLLAWGRVAS